MRILLNARPAHGAYTGVGCYIWNLLDQLGRRPEVEQLASALLPPLMRAVTMLACPGHNERFGLCPLRAVACGREVLASDIPPLRETPHDVELFAEPRSLAAIAHGLRPLRALVGTGPR